MTHTKILELWPSKKELAKRIDQEWQTVYMWQYRNNIHSDHWESLVNDSHDLDLGVTYKMLATAETGV